MRLLVVGASLAGLRAAQAARSAGHTGELVVIGAERHPPYTRPPLSKELLHGTQTADACAFPLGELDVDWRLGRAATALDRSAHEVTLADGARVPYDRLIIATGCRARQWHGPGSGLAGVHTLRDLDDATALRDELKTARHLLIVGAGFIGCEVAASARSLGLEVTLVDIAPHPMMPLGPELGRRWLELHREHGVVVRTETGIGSLHGDDGRVSRAELSDGSRVDADAVLIALGSQLNSEWPEGSGIELGRGVITDATLTTTTDEDILAAGDIAACPVALAGGEPTRIEHWTTAAEHGRLAGRNALLLREQRAAHTTTPYFWSDQYGIKIQAIGFPPRGQTTEVLEHSPDGERLVTASVLDGQVVGVVAINAARRLAWYRRRLTGTVSLNELRAQITSDPDALQSLAGAQP